MIVVSFILYYIPNINTFLNIKTNTFIYTEVIPQQLSLTISNMRKKKATNKINKLQKLS